MDTPRPGQLVAPAPDPKLPTWHTERIPACPRCGLYHDPRDHDGGHQHAHPGLFEPCLCGQPYPRQTIRWPWADGAWLEVATVNAIATGNLDESTTRTFRLATRCTPRGLPGTRRQRRRSR